MLVCVPLPVCQMRSGTGRLVCLQSLRPRLVRSASTYPREVCPNPDSPGRRLFLVCEGANEFGRHLVRPDVEVQQRTLGLRAPVHIRRDFDLAHAVGFNAGASGALCGGGHRVFLTGVEG